MHFAVVGDVSKDYKQFLPALVVHMDSFTKRWSRFQFSLESGLALSLALTNRMCSDTMPALGLSFKSIRGLALSLFGKEVQAILLVVQRPW